MTLSVPFERKHRKEFFDETRRGNKRVPMKLARGGRPCWTRFLVLRCLHRAHVISADDIREAGCLNSMCNVCPRKATEHFYRVGPCRQDRGRYMWDYKRRSWKIGRMGFERSPLLYVREVGGRLLAIDTFRPKYLWRSNNAPGRSVIVTNPYWRKGIFIV